MSVEITINYPGKTSLPNVVLCSTYDPTHVGAKVSAMVQFDVKLHIPLEIVRVLGVDRSQAVIEVFVQQMRAMLHHQFDHVSQVLKGTAELMEHTADDVDCKPCTPPDRG